MFSTRSLITGGTIVLGGLALLLAKGCGKPPEDFPQSKNADIVAKIEEFRAEFGPEALGEDDLRWLDFDGIDVADILKYNKRFFVDPTYGYFNTFGPKRLVKAGISPEIADRFDARLNGNNIANITEQYPEDDTIPEVTRHYSEEFTGRYIQDLLLAGVFPDTANPFHNRFKTLDSCSHSSYHWGHNPIVTLIKSGYTADEANQFGDRYCHHNIALFTQCAERIGITDRDEIIALANSYHPAFRGDDGVELISQKVMPDTANPWGEIVALPHLYVSGTEVAWWIKGGRDVNEVMATAKRLSKQLEADHQAGRDNTYQQIRLEHQLTTF